ncbi:MAG: class I SAM-dependent methyltransferase [Proteobacteria bacterium]|nr:class I SAM-dependent methyltransferase [Pseudomonadota bacterium]
MAEQEIRFNDGAGYERMMGIWSRLAGEIFLDWLKPDQNLKWIDIGCGNGAFTELIARRCAPAEIQGVDPSEGQLAFARTRGGLGSAEFRVGHATALPFPARAFDVAVMALVIFFVPDPAKGVAEMVRVVAPGGTVTAYAWDMEGGGFPLRPILTELRAIGLNPARPPSVAASRMEALQALWTDAGMTEVETHRIKVQRTFSSFEDVWESATLAPTMGPALASLAPDDLAQVKARVRESLPEDSAGRVTYGAWANAVKGRVPK